MYTRSDFKYCNDHPNLMLFKNDYIWIVQGEEYYGVTDRHLFTSRRFFLNTLDLLENIFVNYTILYNLMNSKNDWNLEQFILEHLKYHKISQYIQFFPRLMYSVRSSDVSTRWQTGLWDAYENLFVKYPNEKLNAGFNCKIFPNSSAFFDLCSSQKK